MDTNLAIANVIASMQDSFLEPETSEGQAAIRFLEKKFPMLSNASNQAKRYQGILSQLPLMVFQTIADEPYDAREDNEDEALDNEDCLEFTVGYESNPNQSFALQTGSNEFQGPAYGYSLPWATTTCNRPRDCTESWGLAELVVEELFEQIEELLYAFGE